MASLDGLIEIFLQPGDLFVATPGYQIRTILGSCVSMTLWHPPTGTGGMSHFLLPTRGTAVKEQEWDGRYGDEALQTMLSQLRSMGISPKQCQAKIFGGGNMFPDHMRDGVINVGMRNGQAARELLLQHGIPLVSECLYGVGHRQNIFFLTSARAMSGFTRFAPREGRFRLHKGRHGKSPNQGDGGGRLRSGAAGGGRLVGRRPRY